MAEDEYEVTVGILNVHWTITPEGYLAHTELPWGGNIVTFAATEKDLQYNHMRKVAKAIAEHEIGGGHE
ncbi:MAG: hypothetical protein LC754_10575 [Acidobacteria bacterium]|nr:hypothetical protein [Acidobacteriota bacterium]